MSKKLLIRELLNSETDQILTFRNKIFNTIDRKHWDAMNNTAVVAKKGIDYWGVIPLQYRDHKINKTTSIKVVFENAVGVSEQARGTGIGTLMIEEAANFLKNRIDALYVFRGAERTPAYRFYRKTGHSDIFYHTNLKIKKPIGKDNSVEVLNYSEAIKIEPKLFKLFNSCYGDFGGYREREKGYYKMVAQSHVYKSEQWKLYLLKEKSDILAYAIVAPNYFDNKSMAIYEVAAKSNNSLKKVLDKIEFEAKRSKRVIIFNSSCEDPFYKEYIKQGFSEVSSTPYIMGRILNGKNIFKKLAAKNSISKEIKLTCITPHRDVVLNSPKGYKYSAKIYLKEAQLTRLLSCREDLPNALRTGSIRITDLPVGIKQKLFKVFQFTPWVSFGLDYV